LAHWPLLLAAALGFRLLLSSSPLWLSDDLYRYLLDGRVLEAGVNPFRHPPSHPRIVAIDAELVARVNHPQVPTIYPLSTQLVAWAAARFDLDGFGWRLWMCCFDLAAMFAVAALWGGGAAGRRAAAIYGLCPLAVVESAASGHLEPLLNLCFVGACLLWTRRWIGAAALLAAAVLVKFTPVLALPALWRRPGAARVLGCAAVLSLGGLLVFARPGVDLWAAMRNYLTHWSFNGPLFTTLRALHWPESGLRVLPWLWLLAAAWRWRRAQPTWHALAWLYFGFLIAGPTLHPWYALWLLPWLGPRPHWGLWCFVLAMGFAYAVHLEVARSGEYRLAPHFALALWAAVGLGFVAQWRRQRSASGPS
jgi:hypothetical protein